MRSNPQDLDRKYLNCTRKLETGFCQSQTGQTGRMDRSDRSLTETGERLGFDDLCSGKMLENFDKQC